MRNQKIQFNEKSVKMFLKFSKFVFCLINIVGTYIFEKLQFQNINLNTFFYFFLFFLVSLKRHFKGFQIFFNNFSHFSHYVSSFQIF